MIMKLIRFLVLGILVFNIPVLLYAQKKNKPLLSTVDKKGQTVSPENAFYLDVRTYRNDSTWEFSRYLYAGPIVFLKTYRDREMTELHGYVAYYDSRGRVDSSGYISGGQKDSWWNYFTDSLTVYETVVYKNGQVTYRQDRQKPGSEQKKPDSTAIIVEKEAYFKKGVEEWTKYIQKTIKIPKRFQSLGHTGIIRVAFIVNTDGKVIEPHIQQSVEYSADEEALRIIRESPDWMPALQGGRRVKAFRVQPFTFTR